MRADNNAAQGARSNRNGGMELSLVAHFEFLMASSMIDGVVLSVAVLQAERDLPLEHCVQREIPRPARKNAGSLMKDDAG